MGFQAIDRLNFDAGRLMCEYPPQWYHSNKQLVYEISQSSGFPNEGEIVYSRWPAQALRDRIVSSSQFHIQPGVFSYETPKKANIVAWHLNFADPELFVAYNSALLAQDELQVAEHPALGSVREALITKGLPTITADFYENPTPVTITGVQRRCAINTHPIPEVGIVSGLYGNAFSSATESQVRAATRALSPPTISNILAMAAPSYGYGEYNRKDIINILVTAYTGFLAARAESDRLAQSPSQTMIHTGFWGCGAFGGNRTLMTILQSLAADLAGTDIVFWAFDDAGVQLAKNARKWYEQVRQENQSTDSLIDRLVLEAFEWGVSDGN